MGAVPVAPAPVRRSGGARTGKRARNITPAQARRLVDALTAVRAGRDCPAALTRAIDDLREMLGPWYDDREDARR